LEHIVALRPVLLSQVQRLLLTYSFGDFLNVGVGRFHSAIGYYNTAYHHSTWLQTTTGRPFLFQFEDQGGILPIHNVGATASGRIPSGALGLHYVAEVGNGRSSRSPLNEPVQNVLDENNRKSVNFAVFARPDAVRGLQAGFSIYRDLLAPQNSPRIGETIFAAHAVYVGLNLEWLNEALVLRHAPQGTSRVFDSTRSFPNDSALTALMCATSTSMPPRASRCFPTSACAMALRWGCATT